MASWQGVGALAPAPKFLAVGFLLENNLVGKFLSISAKFGAKNPFWGDLLVRLKF